jgi:hypothetical protein
MADRHCGLLPWRLAGDCLILNSGMPPPPRGTVAATLLPRRNSRPNFHQSGATCRFGTTRQSRLTLISKETGNHTDE